MKKIKEFIKKNLKVIVAFIIGIMISGVGVYAATILYNANEIGYDNTNVTIEKTSGGNATNVQEAIEALYEKASNAGGDGGNGQLQLDYNPTTCTAPPAELSAGKYVTITPNSSSFSIAPSLTGYTTTQTITPNELTKWRIIKVNDCNVEVVSEYVSSTKVYFRGIVGYRNFVGTLNIIASAYENPTYTVGSRMMGFDGQTEIIKDISAFDGSTNTAPSETSTSSPTTGTGEEYSGGVLGDTLYLKDYLLVNNVYGDVKAQKVGTTTNTTYWIASRSFYWSSASDFSFNSRYVSASGNLSNRNFRFFYSSRWSVSHDGCSLRPILTLKSGLTISGGSGTNDSPYTLS